MPRTTDEFNNYVANELRAAQLWFPIPSHGLRAPLTWSVMPGRGD